MSVQSTLSTVRKTTFYISVATGVIIVYFLAWELFGWWLQDNVEYIPTFWIMAAISSHFIPRSTNGSKLFAEILYYTGTGPVYFTVSGIATLTTLVMHVYYSTEKLPVLSMPVFGRTDPSDTKSK